MWKLGLISVKSKEELHGLKLSDENPAMHVLHALLVLHLSNGSHQQSIRCRKMLSFPSSCFQLEYVPITGVD